MAEAKIETPLTLSEVKTTNPKMYCVRPNTGIVLPRSTCDVTVTMQAQKEAPPDLQCKDKFLLQSVKANDGANVKDITAEMFNKDSGNVVEEVKLRVLYVSPPQPPSPVREGSEEGSSPRASFSENGNGSEFANASRSLADRFQSQDKSAEARSLIAKLTEEKNNAIQQSKRLRQELPQREFNIIPRGTKTALLSRNSYHFLYLNDISKPSFYWRILRDVTLNFFISSELCSR